MDVLNINNEVVGKVDLASWWDERRTPSLIHQAVVAARAGARRGTHSTKGRTDVRGEQGAPGRVRYALPICAAAGSFSALIHGTIPNR